MIRIYVDERKLASDLSAKQVNEGSTPSVDSLGFYDLGNVSNNSLCLKLSIHSGENGKCGTLKLFYSKGFVGSSPI